MRPASTDIQLKLETAVLTACRQSLPLDNLEVDAIICVNVADRQEEHVVKIHQRFDRCGPPNRNLVKVNVLPHNNNNMVVDKVDFENNTDVKGLENGTLEILNVPFVPAIQDSPHSKKVKSEKLEVNHKFSNASPTGSSASKHKRKSSTPRYLNPRFRLKNVDNMLEMMTEKSDRVYDTVSGLSNITDNGKLNYDINGELNEVEMKWEGNLRSETVNGSSYKDSNKFIKIEPKVDNDITGIKDILHDNGITVSDEKQLIMPIDSSEELGHTAENSYTIELNSDSESYDTTYNYTFDKTVDEMEESAQGNLKSFNDSDDQSLGSSPSDLTNSMMSYNVGHIMTAGTLSETWDILDVPNYKSCMLGGDGKIKTESGGKWNDLKSAKRTVIPTSVEKLSCKTCGAVFSSTRTRRRHETSTCGATRFSCVVCSKLFSRKDARRRHIMRMHPEFWNQTSQAERNSRIVQT